MCQRGVSKYMAEGEPEQVVVPVEGGGNSLPPFVLHKERKFIKKIYGNEKGDSGRRGGGRADQAWKAGSGPATTAAP